MRTVDLSQPLAAGMPVYPGDPEVTIAPALTVDADGVAVSRLDFGSHSGTHLDAPAHVRTDGGPVEAIPLEWLWGEARVLRVVAPRAGGLVGTADLDLPSALPRIVCIATGWDAHFGTEAALAHPALSRELAAALWDRGARVLGVDTLSPDPTGGDAGMPVHELWLGRGGAIIENLAGLEHVPDVVELSVLPLRLVGIDGSPVRAVARFPESTQPTGEIRELGAFRPNGPEISDFS